MENNGQQEMNIFQVMARVGRAIGGFFCGIGSFLGRIAQLAYQYKYLFLTVFALVVAFSVYQRRDKAKIYRAKMHIQINDGDVFIYNNLIEQLTEYAKKNDAEGLANAMNTSTEVTSQIEGFELFHIIDLNHDSILDFVDYKKDVKLGDTAQVIVSDQAVIRVKLHNLDYCGEIEKALLSYFSRNDYLSSLNITRLASLEEREWMFHNALLNLDSLQKIEYFQPVPSYAMEFASKSDYKKPIVTAKRQLYYEDMKKLFDINEEIAVDMSTNLEVATVVSKLQPEYKLENPTWKIILINALAGLAVFTLLAFILDNKEQILNYLKNEVK